MCTCRVRYTAVLTIITLIWIFLLPPAIATVPEVASDTAAVAKPASLVIAITSAGLADAEVTVMSKTEVAWQNNTPETLQIFGGAHETRIYLPLVLHNSAETLADERAAQASYGGGDLQASGLATEWGGTVTPGATYTHTFDVPGTYPYYVASHPNWRGKVIVVDVPPDPVEVAPPVDPSVATDFSDATSFLYTGPNPIQTGVAPGTIKAQTVAVLRGKVTDRDGNPLPLVSITVLDHPELGQTLTREDGMFDLAVNGGGPLTLDYARDGYLPAQRQVDAPWRDYAWAPDVVLIPLDSAVTSVTLEAGAMQVARGSPVSDDDGTRQATLLVPAGTGAQIVLSGGVTQTVTALDIRATEYTVGDNGPEAMPAGLPANVGYTYAFELSADQALTAGATEVVFDQPLPYYVENFLHFPVGSAVPMGYYDRARGQWVASESGRVVGVTGVSGGLADLDTDGDGIADNGAVITPTMVITITTAERSHVAALYSAGTSLWRAPISHFSPWDANWAFSPPPDATSPNQPPPKMRKSSLDPCPEGGSTIGCDSQTLGEDVEIAGTPFLLHYASDRVKGRNDDYTLSIPLSGGSVPASLLSIVMEVHVAGRTFTSSYPAALNQTATFTWNGQDAYGRDIQGLQQVVVGIGYVYRGVYKKTERFGYLGGGLISGDMTRQELTLWQRWKGTLGHFDASGIGLGGWSVDASHLYDYAGTTIHLGDGRTHSARGVQTIGPFFGGGLEELSSLPSSGEGQPATRYWMAPHGIAPSPDGGLYVWDLRNSNIPGSGKSARTAFFIGSRAAAIVQIRPPRAEMEDRRSTRS